MKLLVPVVGGIVLLDQLTKAMVREWMPLHTMREIVPGLFNLVHVRNTGAAFSLLAGAHSSLRLVFLVGLTLLVMGILFYAYRKLSPRDRWVRVAYSLILGGAVGNLVDRVWLGEVVDFLDFYVGTYHWPAFNVADTAISTGAVMVLLSFFRWK